MALKRGKFGPNCVFKKLFFPISYKIFPAAWASPPILCLQYAELPQIEQHVISNGTFFK